MMRLCDSLCQILESQEDMPRVEDQELRCTVLCKRALDQRTHVCQQRPVVVVQRDRDDDDTAGVLPAESPR